MGGVHGRCIEEPQKVRTLTQYEVKENGNTKDEKPFDSVSNFY